jgi:hypothetical protein
MNASVQVATCLMGTTDVPVASGTANHFVPPDGLIPAPLAQYNTGCAERSFAPRGSGGGHLRVGRANVSPTNTACHQTPHANLVFAISADGLMPGAVPSTTGQAGPCVRVTNGSPIDMALLRGVLTTYGVPAADAALRASPAGDVVVFANAECHGRLAA